MRFKDWLICWLLGQRIYRLWVMLDRMESIILSLSNEIPRVKEEIEEIQSRQLIRFTPRVSSAAENWRRSRS